MLGIYVWIILIVIMMTMIYPEIWIFSIIGGILMILGDFCIETLKDKWEESRIKNKNRKQSSRLKSIQIPATQPEYPEVDKLIQQAKYYDWSEDHDKERIAYINAIKVLMENNGLANLYLPFVNAFNDPCQKPPESISTDENINRTYQKLLTGAKNAIIKGNRKLYARNLNSVS